MSKQQNGSLLLGAAALAALAVYMSQSKSSSSASSGEKFKGGTKIFKNSIDYIKQMYPYAKAAQERTNVPANVNLLISAVESGYGKHAPGNNYHGIKASKSWTGDITKLKTPECVPSESAANKLHAELIEYIPAGGSGAFKACTNKGDGTAWINDKFRAYPNAAGSFLDFGNFLKENSRYKPAFEFVDNPKEFGRFILTHGYSTAQYVDTFLSLIDNIDKIIKSIQ